MITRRQALPRGLTPIALLLGLVLTLAGGTASAGPRAVPVCAEARIGLLAPLSGDAATAGREQRSFARFAVLEHNARNTIDLALVPVDTRLEPGLASAAASRLAADRRILAVIGPAASEEALAIGPIFHRAQLPYVSGTARRESLTDGSLPTFFRVVPHDGAQGPTIAGFVKRTLKARQAVVIDDQAPDSLSLAASIGARLRAAGVAVTRKSALPETADFAPLIGELEPGFGVLVLAWQSPITATLFGRQLRSAGYRVPIFGTDTLDSAEFKVNGSYVTAFVPNVSAIEENADLLARYRARFGPFATKFGPPVYVAAQAAANAIRNACRDGRATRAEVVEWVRRTFIPRSLLGTRIQFTARGDVRGATFSIFQRESGVWKMVG